MSWANFDNQYIKIKNRISNVYAFLHKEKKISLLFNDTFFCKCPVLIYLHARELFMFYFRLLTFYKIKYLQKNTHPGPPPECQTVWSQIKTDILLVFIWVQNVCERLLADDKFSAGMQRVITGKYFSVQYIVSYRLLSP